MDQRAKMELPAFKKLEKMPDAELRSLAAGKGANQLMDHFISEMAKDMKQAKHAVNPAPPDAQPEGANLVL